MNVSVLVATFGDQSWSDLAQHHAVPSAQDQDALEVLWYHESAGTLAGVRNRLAGQASGEWLCFVDADDLLGYGYLEAMRAGTPLRVPTEGRYPPTLLVPSVQFVRDGYCVGEAAVPNRGRWPEVNECVIGTLIQRSLFEQLGGFRDELADGTPLPSLEDYDLFLRAFDAGAELVYVEDAVYCATLRPASRNFDQSPYAAIWAEHLARTT